MDHKPHHIAIISDMHLLADKEGALLGVKTQESLEAVLAQLKLDPTPLNAILLSGDLSQDGSEISYLRLADLFKDFQVPVYCVPGNHDDNNTMMNVYPHENISHDRYVILGNWLFILLDSCIPGAVEGQLKRSQLDYLERYLEAYPTHHVVIVFHHHPVASGSAWLDKLGLQNASEFWQILSQYPQQKTVLFGHVHQDLQGEKEGVRYYSTPSTCIQFKSNTDPFELEKLPQGYRWMDLYPTGELKTGICRVPAYIGVFDTAAKGY